MIGAGNCNSKSFQTNAVDDDSGLHLVVGTVKSMLHAEQKITLWQDLEKTIVREVDREAKRRELKINGLSDCPQLNLDPCKGPLRLE